jgi:trimeric autotransporter adhesin
MTTTLFDRQRVVRRTGVWITLLLAACGGGGGEGIVRTNPVPPSIAVSPTGPLTLARGTTAAVSATVTGSTSAIRWRSSDVSVVTVTPDAPPTTARITAVAAGSASIIAELADQSSVSAAITITVTTPPPAIVTISPATASTNVGDSVFFTTQLGGPAGAEGRVTECRTSSAAVATARLLTAPSIGCRATGVAPGTATITAVLDNGNAAAAQLTVNANRDAIRNLVVTPATPSILVGASIPLSVAVDVDNAGVSVTRRFESSAPAVATVDSTGRVVGLTPGTTNVTVTVQGAGGGTRATTLSQVVTVTVRPNVPALRGFTVAPRTADVSVGRTQALTITTDRADPSVTVTAAFISRAPTVATVPSAEGLVSAVAPGTATIVVSVTGTAAGFAPTTLTDSVTVRVIALPPSITNLRVSPSPASVGRGTTLPLVARVDSANATVRPTFAYSSSNTAIATVSSSGVVTGVANGAASVTVTARGGGTNVDSTTLTATVPITVIDRPAISNLVASPDSIRLVSVGRQAPIAVRYDSVADARVTVSYQSSAPSVATVSAQGIVTVASPGSANIIVTASGTSPTASPATLVDTVAVGAWQIALSPASLTLAWASTQQVTATVTGGFAGQSLPLLWRSGNTAVGTVSATGLVTAISPGVTTISAQSSVDPSSSGGTSALTVPCRPTITANWGQTVSDSVTLGNCSFGTSNFSSNVIFNGTPTQASFTATSLTATSSWRPNTGGGNDAWRLATTAGGQRVSVVNPNGQAARMNIGSDVDATTPSGRFTIGQSTTASSPCDFVYAVRGVSYTATLSNACAQRVYVNPRFNSATTIAINGFGPASALPTTITVRLFNEVTEVGTAQVFTFAAFVPQVFAFTRNVGAGLYEIRLQTTTTGNFTFTIP